MQIDTYQYANGETFEGKIIDVDGDGKLKMLVDNHIQTFNIKEFNFLY
jgi:hypothetical protein